MSRLICAVRSCACADFNWAAAMRCVAWALSAACWEPAFCPRELLRAPEVERVIFELGFGPRNSRLLDVDGRQKRRFFKAVEQVTLLDLATVHEELVLDKGRDARHGVDAVHRLDPGIEVVNVGHRSAF